MPIRSMPSGTLKSRLLRRVAVFSCMAVGVGAFASPVSAKTLLDALSLAYATNPSLMAERALLRATDEGLPQALSNWRPTVTANLTGGITRNAQEQDITGGGGASSGGAAGPGAAPGSAGGSVGGSRSASQNLSPRSFSLTVQQPIYRGGRTEAQADQALNLIRAERARLVAMEQQVFLTVVTDYMNVVRDQAALELNINNEEVLRRQLEAVRDRFRVGEVTRTDVAQAEASYALATSQRRQAEGNLAVSRATYEKDVGEAPGRLTPPETLPELPTNEGDAAKLASGANPNVVAAQFAQQAAEDQIRLVRGQFLPTLSLQAQISRSIEGGQVGFTNDSMSLTAQLQIPIYEAGAVFSQSRQAQQTVAQRRSQVDDARRSAFTSAAGAYEQLKSVRATIVSQKEQIRANEIALEGVKQESAVGSRTVLDVLNQEQTLFQSRVNLLQSQRDEVVAAFTLVNAVGRLSARDLGLEVVFYDPDRNLNAVKDKFFGFGTGQ